MLRPQEYFKLQLFLYFARPVNISHKSNTAPNRVPRQTMSEKYRSPIERQDARPSGIEGFAGGRSFSSLSGVVHASASVPVSASSSIGVYGSRTGNMSGSSSGYASTFGLTFTKRY